MSRLVISLTSIPPRFAQLPRVVAALRAQRARPARIIVTLPHQYLRFPGCHTPPNLEGVEILRPEIDEGPIAKVSGAARLLRGLDCHLLYCDDDWLYGPQWAQGFVEAAQEHPGAVICASSFTVRRLGLRTAPDSALIAQGFGGVMIRPDWLDDAALEPPAVAWAVDDIWLSAQYARLGRALHQAAQPRRHAHPLADPDSLQKAHLNGVSRAEANRKTAHRLAEEYHIWGA